MRRVGVVAAPRANIADGQPEVYFPTICLKSFSFSRQ
jgi:hypothetical protein